MTATARRGGQRWAVAIVLAAVLAACTGGGEPDAPPPTGGASGDQSRPPEGVAGLTWRRSEAPSLRSDRLGATLGAVLAEPDGSWAVAGTVFHPGRPPAPTVWRSPGGEEWTAVPLGDEGGGRLLAAAAAGETVVVAGQRGVDLEGPAAVYVAAPGGDFTSVDDEVFAQPGLSIDVLAGGDGGFVGAGDRRDPSAEIAVVGSDDGRTWEVLADAERLVNEATAPGVSGAATGAGGSLLVGSSGGASGRTGAVWHSADGVTWSRVATFLGTGDVGVNAVAVDGTGFVAVGHEEVAGLREPRVWRSADGSEWQPSPSDFEIRDRGTDNEGVTVRSVARGGGDWIAVGGGAAGERVWRSSDLQRWRELPLPEGPGGIETPALSLLAASGDTALMGAAANGRPVLLRESAGTITEVTATDTAFPEPRTDLAVYDIVTTGQGPFLIGDVVTRERALGGRRLVTRMWRPDPSQDWQQVDAGDAFDQAEVTDVVELGDELVAVGQQTLADDVFSEADPRGLVWTSSDGSSWSKVAGPGVEALVGASTTDVRAAAAAPPGVVAVGTVLDGDARRIDAAFWSASDPQEWTRGIVTGELPPDVRDNLPFDVCVVGDTSVAVGFGVTPGGDRGLVWTSQGGLEWEVAAPPVMAGPGSWQLTDCTATPDGIVAVGLRGAAEPEEFSAGMWTSNDGREWELVESTSFAGDDGFRVLRAVAVAGSQRFAVGQYRQDGRTRPGLWWSAGGSEWELVELPAEVFQGDLSESIEDLAVIDGELLLVGWVDADAAVWRAALPADD